MIIELIGPPGSGKSTLAENLRRRGHQNLQGIAMAVIHAEYGRLWSAAQTIGSNIPIIRRGFQPGLIVDAWATRLLNHGRISAAFHHGIQLAMKVGVNQQDFARLLHRMLLHNAHTEAIEAVTAGKERSIIADEYWLQTALSLGPIRNGDEDLSSLGFLLDTVPMPDLLIVLSTPPEQCLQRILLRHRGPPQVWHGLDQRDMLARLEACSTMAENLARNLGTRGVTILSADAALAEEYVLCNGKK